MGGAEKYVNITKPINPDEDKAIGKSLYSKHYKSCHGKQGYRDGNKADEVEGDLGGFFIRRIPSSNRRSAFSQNNVWKR